MPPTMQPATEDGRRKLPETARSKLSAVNRAKWDALPEEEKQRRREHMARIRPKARGASTTKGTARSATPTSENGGPRGFFEMTPLEALRAGVSRIRRPRDASG